MTSSNTIQPDTAFAIYYAMGPKRSLAKLVGAIGVELGLTVGLKTLERWSSLHGWQSRIAEIEQERAALQVAKYIEEAPSITAKALNALDTTISLVDRLLSQAKLAEHLEIKSLSDFKIVIDLLINATKMAEVLQGSVSDRVETRRPISPDYDAREHLNRAIQNANQTESGPIVDATPQDIDINDGRSNAGVIVPNKIH